jgi:acetylornithine deacetylase/succinyl-diaminopimelate desuccinylase-like protein
MKRKNWVGSFLIVLLACCLAPVTIYAQGEGAAEQNAAQPSAQSGQPEQNSAQEQNQSEQTNESAPPARDANIQLARDIFKQLIEINTTDSVGSTTIAAEAMAKRLRDAGFPASDVVVMGPADTDRKGNMVARLHGNGAHKPVLLIGHLDVVEARRSDWTYDPFKFTYKDGYWYGRGTQDMKDGDSIMVATLMRLKQEGFQPDRDIIVALTADEEGGSHNGVDWLIKNHRDLVDA